MRPLTVPRHSLALCAGIALFMPWFASLPDLPFGHWHPLLGSEARSGEWLSLAFSVLFLYGLNAMAISPVYLAGQQLARYPLAFWMALAAYLATALWGYGSAYRALGGDGLEYLAALVWTGIAALCGGELGWALSGWCRSALAQAWLVCVALLVAVCGALAWSVEDASGFAERQQAWHAERQARWQAAAAARPAETASRAAPPAPQRTPQADAVPQRACLGHASADGNIRLFSASECAQLPGGQFFTNGECLKAAGGSYSWDLRGMNRSCP